MPDMYGSSDTAYAVSVLWLAKVAMLVGSKVGRNNADAMIDLTF